MCFSNFSHFHDISARGFTATEIVAIQRFARTLRDFPFLITSGSWVDFALVLIRLRTRSAARLGAPVWVPRTAPLWRIATHGPTGYHHNVQNISNIHLNGSACVHDFKNPRIFHVLSQNTNVRVLMRESLNQYFFPYFLSLSTCQESHKYMSVQVHTYYAYRFAVYHVRL